MREIDAATALAWAKAGTARIVDVREPAEFASIHIVGARSIPLGMLDHVEIARNEIKLSTREDENSVWGVATWTDVDPALNFFAIDVRGLTNAYQINVDSGGEKRFYRKTLRIYFWRPGDSFNVPKDRVYLGSPAYEDPKRVQYYLDQFSLKERLDYQWIYR